MTAWRPVVVVVEADRELAVALKEVVTLARCQPIVLGVEELRRLASPPAAIVIRLATAVPCPDLPLHPAEVDGMATKVLALASTDAHAAEATRIGADAIFREPRQVHALYEALVTLAENASAGES
jgi:hypothetical protein